MLNSPRLSLTKLICTQVSLRYSMMVTLPSEAAAANYLSLDEIQVLNSVPRMRPYSWGAQAMELIEAS